MEQRSHMQGPSITTICETLPNSKPASRPRPRLPIATVLIESRRTVSMIARAGPAQLTTTPVLARGHTRARAACPRLPLERLPQGDPSANGHQAASQHQYREGEHFDLPGRPKGSTLALCGRPRRMDEGCPCRSAAVSRIENPFQGSRTFEQSSTLVLLLARGHRVKRTA